MSTVVRHFDQKPATVIEGTTVLEVADATAKGPPAPAHDSTKTAAAPKQAPVDGRVVAA
jgi:hypothetical protein